MAVVKNLRILSNVACSYSPMLPLFAPETRESQKYTEDLRELGNRLKPAFDTHTEIVPQKVVAFSHDVKKMLSPLQHCASKCRNHLSRSRWSWLHVSSLGKSK